MMRILFVYPTTLDVDGNPIKYKYALYPSLILATLHALTPEYHKVDIIDDRVQNIDYSVEYDLVGITGLTAQIERVYQIAAKFKNKKTRVIIGGQHHASALPDEVKQYADSVVIGEVEDIWQEILADCENNDLKEFYKAHSFPDLRKLTIPRWDHIDFTKYVVNSAKLPRTMPLSTTRGCVFNCSYCSVSKLYGKQYRAKPIEHVLQEVDNLKGAGSIFFVDDNIVCNPSYSRELFKQLKRKNIYWVSQASTTILKNPDLITLAAESGCIDLFLGIESVQKDNLAQLNKGFNNTDQYAELFSRIKKAGINPQVSIIFGLDSDTVSTMRSTLDFLDKTKISEALFWVLTPIPGTTLFDEMEKQGRILHKNWTLFDGLNVVYRPKNFTPEELYENYWNTYQKFYTMNKTLKMMWINRSVYFSSLFQFQKRLRRRSLFRKRVMKYASPFDAGIGKLNKSKKNET